ncbi:MAG: DUF4446 family protein [Patescibacteria group bacterium]|nr:DUF4446 family protein [Patescibacteria group bacterium]
MNILIIILFLITLGISGYTLWEQNNLKKKYGQFLVGAEAKQIEEQIKSYSGDVDKALSQLDELAGFAAKLHKTQQFAISKVGLVRFNPFGDTGGDHSFSMALLDHMNNGMVISAVHARSGTRVYAKDIIEGESKHNLSKEEAKALSDTSIQKIK